MAICALLTFLRALTIVGQAFFLSYAICGLWDGQSLENMVGAMLCFAGSFALCELLVFVQESFIDSFAVKSVATIQGDFAEALYDRGATSLREYGTPATVALLIDGSEDIAQYIRISFPKLTDCAIIPLVLLIAILSFDLISGIIALICLPFIFIFMRLIGMSAKDEASKRHAQFERLSNSFVNKALGIVDLKSFGADGRFAKIIYDTSESFRRITMKTLRVSMLSSAVLDLFATLALAAVAIMLGFRMVEGTVEFLPALCVLVLVPEYFKPVREFGSNYHETLNGKESLRIILQRIGESSRIKDPSYESKSETSQIKGEAPTIIGESPGIKSETNSFWANSLRDKGFIEINTARPSLTAITGASGSGKTTLLNALSGLTEPPGDFRFIVNGESKSNLRDPSWRKRVAYIPQDPHIFNDTIRENVRFYVPDATDERVHDALEAVGLSELIDDLPDGIETVIGEGGRALSGGQLARIALSRALIDEKRDIWLMDEPSAHIDNQTETEVMQAIIPLLKDKVAFISTHSDSLAATADAQIFVSNSCIDEGEEAQ